MDSVFGRMSNYKCTSVMSRIEELESHHGGMKKAAAHCGLKPWQWKRIKGCSTTDPSDEVLEKLGLIKKTITLYVQKYK